MRGKIKLSLQVGPDTDSKASKMLEVGFEPEDAENATFATKEFSLSSETAPGVNTFGVAVTVDSGADPASALSKTSSIRFSCNGTVAAKRSI